MFTEHGKNATSLNSLYTVFKLFRQASVVCGLVALGLVAYAPEAIVTMVTACVLCLVFVSCAGITTIFMTGLMPKRRR